MSAESERENDLHRVVRNTSIRVKKKEISYDVVIENYDAV